MSKASNHTEAIHCTCCHDDFEVECVLVDVGGATGWDAIDDEGGPAWVFIHDAHRANRAMTAGLGMCGRCNADICQCHIAYDLADEYPEYKVECDHDACGNVDSWGDEQDKEEDLPERCEDHSGCRGLRCMGEPDWA